MLKINFLLLSAFALIALSTDSVKAGKMEDKVVKILEEFAARMCHPIPKFGLPALDPFERAHGEISLNSSMLVDFNGSFKDLKLIGLSDAVINKIKFPGIFSQKFIFDISFPLIAMEATYTAKGKVMNIIQLDGSGPMVGRCENLRIVVTFSMKLGGHLQIKNFKIDTKIGKIFMDFGQLIPDDRLNGFFHSIINDIGIDLLEEIWSEKGADIETEIQNIVNEKGKDYTLADLLKILGGSGEPIFGPEDPPGDCKNDVELSAVEVEPVHSAPAVVLVN